MKQIEELVKNVDRYKNVIIQQKFESKKNTVAYVTVDNKPRVLKWFVPGLKKNMENEYNILKQGSKELNIPHPYEIDNKNNVIIMSYISGENLCDIVNDEKTSLAEKERLMILLSNWFVQFHTYFKTADGFHIRGDSNLRNFILSDRIWGVDLEESRIGKPVEDIAMMCSSILSTDPMFTKEKYNLCKIFIKTYARETKWSLNNVDEEIAYALLERIQWRPEQEEILRKHAKIIRRHGFL